VFLGQNNRIYTSPAVIQTDMDTPPQFIPCTSNRLTFVGSETHYPNLDALIWFCKEIAPYLRKQNFTFTLQVVGKWKTHIRELQHSCPEMETVGYIKDLPSFLKGSIALVPIRIGSGMRMKILEAVSADIPFITTTKGVEGIDLLDKEEYLKADENENSLKITNYPNITRKGKLCMAQYFYEEKNDIWVTTWNKLYNLSFLKEFHIHFLEHVYHEDIVMHAMLALNTRSFTLTNQTTYLYNCKREDSITNMEQGYTLKHLNDLTIVFSEIRRLIQADNNLSKHLQKEINLYYLFEIYHRYLPAMYSNIKRVDLIKGLARLSQNCLPPILETRLTFKSIKRFLFLKLPFNIQYLIKSHKYKSTEISSYTKISSKIMHVLPKKVVS
jgi:hypothetical protein